MIYDFSKLDFFLNAIRTIKIIKKKNIDYLNVAVSFDIETSSFYENGNKKAIMYIWQFAIDDNVIYGRTWNEFILLLRKIQSFFILDSRKRMIIYIHNLSYEFQFIRKWIPFSDIFATDERKPLYFVCPWGFEFRCSYRLSGYSLATVAKNLRHSNIKKLVGDLDYSLIRTSNTPIDDKELQYCFNDVLIVTSYINECIEDFGNVANIPLTQTGKVRRYVRDKCFADLSYKYLMRKLELNDLEYLQLRKAFQGGFTHANPMYAMQKMQDVTSYDFTSSYPTVMVCEKFPMSKSKFIGNCDNESFESFYTKNYCCLFDIRLNKVQSKFNFENIISFSKCFRISDRYTLNNGRVFDADFICITITEIDFECIKRFYDFASYEIRNLYIYDKEYLPKPFIESVLKLYSDKTTLKGVVGKETEYLHSKEMLNSCYGMSVTDLINDDYEYFNDEWKTTKANLSSAIDDYNKDRNRFLFYPWGVWVTAYARRNLFSGIYECKDDYIYSDTDSIKILNADNHKNYIDKYNKAVTQKLFNMCKYYDIDFNMVKPKTKDGVEKTLGVWDFDGKYKYFKTLGAKRYLVCYEDNTLSLTVSGVNKKIAVPYLLNKYKNNISDIFNAFTDNLYFPKDYSGKKTLTYIDDEIKGIVKDYLGNYFEYYEKSCVHMENSDYSLSMADMYLDFLQKINKRI